MDFQGRYVIAAPPERVWEGINDPAVLKACIPGCEQLDKLSPTEFVATAKIKIGPVSATFKGKVTLSDMDPPRRVLLSGEGQGGVAGFAKGGAEVTLTPEGGGTVLTYTAKATVGGKLAQIGQRLIDGAAKQIADDFFKRFAAQLAPELPPDPTTDDLAPHAKAEVIAPEPPPRAGVSPVVWVSGLIAVVVVLLLVFGLRP
ncbi:MAG: carbon monoxide dehydrogenase subunit G [Alphaproteobacteria bacterium]|nr:carbon monoxide dehydrogenase subunit G [Alphaproteobacteria bacterium]MBV9421081.1 carbon monoxide dehydrogenase subunit G [Alphaproteobacteria bacterium]MBV9541193.1 carbon monoxide dehydrogenase subunit G [Alphaproteobacteria bacterium]MBV9904672.1 carbon monoxide dehydrogenase subunit G [Alphaproteobacteria bacterium]